MKIYLLGVSHDYQEKPHLKFKEYVIGSCSQHGIRSIAEEMSQDVLIGDGVTVSTIKTIADKLELPHKYCDPARQERPALGILGDQAIKETGKFHKWPDEKVSQEIRMDHAKREYIWLERLKDIFEDPMLFVCGIVHLDTFASLLRSNDYTCEILEKKWNSRPE